MDPHETDTRTLDAWISLLAMIAVILFIVLSAGLWWNNQRLGHERRLKTIEGCATITDSVAKADCYTGDVWE